MTVSVHVVLCRHLCYALPKVHEVDVATQFGLNGGQLLHALLHLHMKLQDKAQHHQCCTLFQLVYSPETKYVLLVVGLGRWTQECVRECLLL